MGESFHLPKGFPMEDQLREVTYKILKKSGKELSTKEIKEAIVKELKLSDQVLNFENSDGLTMLIDYRLRWARTALKNEGKIKNTRRGFWEII